MIKSNLPILLLFLLYACQTEEKPTWNEETLASLGGKFRTAYFEAGSDLEARIEDDSTDVEALVQLAETNIILYIFGFTSRQETIPAAQTAFELSDGTVEVGGGLGHALGDAGYYDLAKQMADSYSLEAQDHYLPPVQRAFIHIGMDDYEMAIQLLEQAYEENPGS